MHRHRTAFTLIELLVVVSIIALLVGILLPALGAAKRAARQTMCGSFERQLGIGIATYAHEYRSLIPRGPTTLAAFPPLPYCQFASSQIWIQGATYNAHGVLLNGYIEDKRAMFCPGDDTSDPTDELARVGSATQNAYSSYMYRQLDETTAERIDDLGNNGLGNKARAFLIDSNSLITAIPNAARTNHLAKQVNILYLDGHVKVVSNLTNIFSLRNMDLAAMEQRLNQIMQNADFVENGSEADVPNP